MAIDARGLPVWMACIDPRYCALHKLWLSELTDREPAKRVHDRAQAMAVANLIADHLPDMRFDDRALEALPRTLRDRAVELIAPTAESGAEW